MAKGQKGGVLKDDDVLRVARITAVQSAAAAWAQTEYDTQLSIERGVIWLIHRVEFGVSPSLSFDISIAAGACEELNFQVTRESKTAMVNLSDPDCIALYNEALVRSNAIGTDAGPLWWSFKTPVTIPEFKVPVPYAAQRIFFGFDATQLNPLTAQCKIYYTVKHVTDQYFFRVAQALLG